ncbi:MAG: hypothetical protein DRO73_11720 [Candidatus Thorarchaeota archaeon]|nr:MAG: hypothetical protein DRO73_11720 [Candidatus Thorarchaeota archaeon]RLI61865.1 MAG: hypothetical protein DRO93_03070 [Candidatus Thorarchaeota archaeon]
MQPELLLIILFSFSLPISVYLLEKRYLPQVAPMKGRVVRETIERHLRKDESAESFFFALFEKYENVPPGSSTGKIEYDSFKETLPVHDPLYKTFNEYLGRWKETQGARASSDSIQHK